MYSSTLTDAVTAEETHFPVAALPARVYPLMLACETEYVLCRGVGEGVIYVDRGALGTERVAHPAGAIVSRKAPNPTGDGGTGATGPAGADGAQGPAGADSTVAGPQGPQGPQGTAGSDGAQGIQGIQGIQGPAGADGAAGEGIPVGIIAMWGGLVASIPSGWHLCDGAAGTPDLRSRFVKGAAAGADPGATGGATTHTHAAHTGVVTHTHVVNVTDGGHSHLTQRYPTTTGASTGFTADTSMSGTPADNTLATKAATTGITAATVAPGGAVSELAHDTPNSEPPYYALAYIQKVA